MISILFLCLGLSLNAQINGISASKLAAFCADLLPKYNLELEPTFNYAHTNSTWNGFDLEKLDSTTISSSVSWRATYGLSDKLEVGLNSSDSEMSFLNLAFKYIISDKNDLKFSVMSGVGLPLGNRTFDPNNKSFDELSNYGLGVITSYQFNETTSLDFNVQIQEYFGSAGDLTSTGYFLNADYGQYIMNEKLLLVMAAAYQSTGANEDKQTLFTLIPGFSLETSEEVFLAFTGSKTLFGYNSSNSWGISLSVTTLLK